MNKQNAKLLLILYLVLSMVIVSLTPTYDLTKKIFGPKASDADYGVGNNIDKYGFIIHIIVFALLAAVPFFFIKEYM